MDDPARTRYSTDCNHQPAPAIPLTHQSCLVQHQHGCPSFQTDSAQCPARVNLQDALRAHYALQVMVHGLDANMVPGTKSYTYNSPPPPNKRSFFFSPTQCPLG
ncbi:hypothetical protein BaRGS_00003506, partial [Batillaria attramentaria]